MSRREAIVKPFTILTVPSYPIYCPKLKSNFFFFFVLFQKYFFSGSLINVRFFYSFFLFLFLQTLSHAFMTSTTKSFRKKLKKLAQ